MNVTTENKNVLQFQIYLQKIKPSKNKNILMYMIFIGLITFTYKWKESFFQINMYSAIEESQAKTYIK